MPESPDSAMKMDALIHEHASRLRDLHAEVRRTFRLRDRDPAGRHAWAAACRQFQTEYDRLAFPGGFQSALRKLRSLEPGTVDRAVDFLAADPWFFRSGYLKGELIRSLKRAPLTARQRERLRHIIVARVQGPGRREFRSYCRLAPVVATPTFVARLQDLARSPESLIARHAQWVLAAVVREGGRYPTEAPPATAGSV